MQRQSSWVIVSIILLVIIIWLYFFPYKPRFVAPKTRQTQLHTILNGIAILAMILLPLNIQFPQSSQVKTTYQTPVQILFDVSLSMAANDIQPSRFTAAKSMVDQLLQWRNSYPTSTILFSGIPFVHMAFGTHTDSARAKWTTTHLWQFPPVPQFVGTAIGDALLLGIQNMESNGFGSWIMVLITDGDSNIWYEPTEVLAILQKKNIPLYTIGIGQLEDFTVWYDYFGGQILTTYNPVFLQEMSDATGWSSWIIQSNEDIAQTTEQIIETIQSRAIVTNSYPLFSLNIILMIVLVVRMVILTTRRWWARYTYK